MIKIRSVALKQTLYIDYIRIIKSSLIQYKLLQIFRNLDRGFLMLLRTSFFLPTWRNRNFTRSYGHHGTKYAPPFPLLRHWTEVILFLSSFWLLRFLFRFCDQEQNLVKSSYENGHLLCHHTKRPTKPLLKLDNSLSKLLQYIKQHPASYEFISYHFSCWIALEWIVNRFLT